MITLVAFQHTVTLTPQGDDMWSASKHPHITCEDKSSHMLFTVKVPNGVLRRIKVPLTNIAYVNEEVDEKPAKGEKTKETP